MFKFYSSNESKLAEYNEYGLPATILKGEDLREVKSSKMDVILHKVKQLPPFCLVEDTSLEIVGTDIGVDIKFRMAEIEDHICSYAYVTTLLAYHDNNEIHVFCGEVKGLITSPRNINEETFGFDDYFTPTGCALNLHEIKKSRTYLNHLPRWIVTQNFITRKIGRSVRLNEIPDWTGEYQK